MSSNLPETSKYIYGTTRLGDGNIPTDERLAIAMKAMEAGVWFHTSHQYGDAQKVIRAASEEFDDYLPNMIFKIGWDSVEQVRGQILEQLEAVGAKKLAIGQLCLGGTLAEQFANGGPAIDELNALKAEGIVDSFVLEVFPWTSENPLKALRAGHADRLVDGFIFYLNPLQRFISNELWDLILEKDFPIIAMRTVCGGHVRQTAISNSTPAWLRERADQVAPIFDESGCSSWTEFCIRFAFGFPQVRATVGSTSQQVNLEEFLQHAPSAQPLPEEIQTKILSLQRVWAEEVDSKAEPWTM